MISHFRVQGYVYRACAASEGVVCKSSRVSFVEKACDAVDILLVQVGSLGDEADVTEFACLYFSAPSRLNGAA